MSNAFRNGTWHFRAGIEPSGKRWEVQYYSKTFERDAVLRFVDEIAAKEFSRTVGGTVREIEPSPFRLQRAR